MADQLVGRLFDDFVAVYQAVTRTRSRDSALQTINQGLCGMAAMAVGQVLIHRYGYTPERVEWRSHCLHMWLRVDGVDYDTLYPGGYPQSVCEEWLLQDVYYSSHEMGESLDDLEANSGYQQPHLWYCQIINEVWYTRYGVTAPDYVLENRGSWLKQSDTADRRANRRYSRRARLALAIPLPTDDTVVLPSTMKPMTHYYYGEFEETTDRVLLNMPYSRVCSEAVAVRRGKVLQKESRTKGIHPRRL